MQATRGLGVGGWFWQQMEAGVPSSGRGLTRAGAATAAENGAAWRDWNFAGSLAGALRHRTTGADKRGRRRHHSSRRADDGPSSWEYPQFVERIECARP
jgi:hypothetical protein